MNGSIRSLRPKRRSCMDNDSHRAALDTEGILFRAALLCGYGPGALSLARRFAAAIDAGGARSCLDAGAPVQLTVDAPGPPGLRIGVRLGERVSQATLANFLPAPVRQRVIECLTKLPAASHPSLGTWLFWTESRQSIFIDLRDPDPDVALARLVRVPDASQRARLEQLRPVLQGARPWVLRVEADHGAITRMHVHWLLDRHSSAERMAEAVAPGCWPHAMRALQHLLRNPSRTGRWVVATPLDDLSESALRIGNSGWAIVPEDERKHRALGEMVRALGGPRDHVEALWSLCRGAAPVDWRVGRACELRIGASDHALRARFFLTPHAQGRTTAGTSSSLDVTSWDGPVDAEPSNA